MSIRTRIAVMSAAVIIIAACTSTAGLDGSSPDSRLGGAGASGLSSRAGVKGLTAEELMTCGTLAQQLRENEVALDTGRRILDASKNLLDGEGRAIDTNRPLVITTDANAVAAFNARLERYHQALEKFNNEVDQYNNRVARSRGTSGEFNVGCANRPYRNTHFRKLPAELQDALKAVGTREVNIPVY